MEEILTDATMVRVAFKKLISYDHRDNAKAYYEETAGGGFNLHASGMWVETPPATPPGTTTSVVKCYVDGADGALKLTQDVSVSGNRGWEAKVGGNRVRGWIPDKFGQLYTVKLYQDNGAGTAKGAQIFTTDAMDWFFDYETGYLAIQDAHTYTIPFWIEAYQYVGNTLTDSQAKLDGIEAGAVALPVVDTTALAKDPADGTRKARLDVGAVATATERTIAMPNQDVDLTPNTGTFPAAAHAARHTNGSDDIQDATVSVKGLMTAAYAAKLDGIAAGADVTAGKSHTVLTDIGTNTHAQIDTHLGATNPHSGSVAGPASATNGMAALFDGTTGKLLKDTTWAAVWAVLAKPRTFPFHWQVKTLAAGDHDIYLAKYLPFACTMKSVTCETIDGTSVTVNIGKRASPYAVTSATELWTVDKSATMTPGTYTTFDNASFAAGDWLVLLIASIVGVTEVTVGGYLEET